MLLYMRLSTGQEFIVYGPSYVIDCTSFFVTAGTSITFRAIIIGVCGFMYSLGLLLTVGDEEGILGPSQPMVGLCARYRQLFG